MLVNTSRGPLVDLETLRKALETGRLSDAALDVLDFVPVDPTRIQGIPNLIATPHMAYHSEGALQD